MNIGSTISTPKQSMKRHHITVPEENATIISLVYEVMGTWYLGFYEIHNSWFLVQRKKQEMPLTMFTCSKNCDMHFVTSAWLNTSFQKIIQNFMQHVLHLRHLQSMDGNSVPILPTVKTWPTQTTMHLRCWWSHKRPPLKEWHGRPENHAYMAVECCSGLLSQQHIETCTAKVETNGSNGRFWQNVTEHLQLLKTVSVPAYVPLFYVI